MFKPVVDDAHSIKMQRAPGNSKRLFVHHSPHYLFEMRFGSSVNHSEQDRLSDIKLNAHQVRRDPHLGMKSACASRESQVSVQTGRRRNGFRKAQVALNRCLLGRLKHQSFREQRQHLVILLLVLGLLPELILDSKKSRGFWETRCVSVLTLSWVDFR
jgi:hypothetical protein